MSFYDNEQNIEELMGIFQTESEEILDRIFERLLTYEKNPEDRENTAALYRDLHSLKGAVRMVGFSNLQMIAHKIEDIFDVVNQKNLRLDREKINLITKSLEVLSSCLKDSVENQREILNNDFNSVISNLEYLVGVDIDAGFENSLDVVIGAIEEVESSVEDKAVLQAKQEVINSSFNLC